MAGQLTATQTLCQSCPDLSWGQGCHGSLVEGEVRGRGGLQEAAAPASGFGSTVNTESDDLTTGMNRSFTKSCPLLPIQSSQTDLFAIGDEEAPSYSQGNKLAISCLVQDSCQITHPGDTALGPLLPFPFLQLPGLAVLLCLTLQNTNARSLVLPLLPRVNISLKECGFPHEKLSSTSCTTPRH